MANRNKYFTEYRNKNREKIRSYNREYMRKIRSLSTCKLLTKENDRNIM